MAENTLVEDAGNRLRGCLHRAKAEGSYEHGWYAQMARWDIEALIDHAIGLDEIKPEPEPASDPGYDLETDTFTTGNGHKITNLHAPSQCVGRGCVIHHPSDHNMRDWPTNWRDGGTFDIKPPHMERMCPHGIGHPDPDDTAYLDSIGENVHVHGCDGCCHPDHTQEAS